MWELTFKGHFDAAHYLPNHPGKCKNLHGHRWEVEIGIATDKLNSDGMVIDFGVLKSLLPDHSALNDFLYNPTAENIAKVIFDEVAGKLDSYMWLQYVTVTESPGAGVTYYE